MKWLVLLTQIFVFVIISVFTDIAILRTKKGLGGFFILFYAIAIYYLSYLIDAWQESLMTKGINIYFDHDGMVNGFVTILIWPLALLNVIIVLYKRVKIGNKPPPLEP